MTDNSLAVVSNETGLSVELMERCDKLKLNERDITAVTQLSTMVGGEPVPDLLVLVENGMTVPRIADCVSLRVDSPMLESCNIEALGAIIDMIGFQSTDQVTDLDVDPSKVFDRGQMLTIDEYEARYYDRLVNGDSKLGQVTEVFFAPHEKMIHEMIEAVQPICGDADPAEFLRLGLETYFDSNANIAYYVLQQDEMEFKAAILAGLDPEMKTRMYEELSPEDKKDFLHGIGELNISPASLGLFDLPSTPEAVGESPDSDEFEEEDLREEDEEDETEDSFE